MYFLIFIKLQIINCDLYLFDADKNNKIVSSSNNSYIIDMLIKNFTLNILDSYFGSQSIILEVVMEYYSSRSCLQCENLNIYIYIINSDLCIHPQCIFVPFFVTLFYYYYCLGNYDIWANNICSNFSNTNERSSFYDSLQTIIHNSSSYNGITHSKRSFTPEKVNKNILIWVIVSEKKIYLLPQQERRQFKNINSFLNFHFVHFQYRGSSADSYWSICNTLGEGKGEREDIGGEYKNSAKC